MEAFEAEPITKTEDAKKPGVRSKEQLDLIKPFIKSLSVFRKNCEQLEDEDYDELARCIKLMKVEKNTRLFNAGDPSMDLLVVLRGQIGIIYPSSILMKLIKEGQESVLERADLLTDSEAEKKKNDTIFITGKTGSTGNLMLDKEVVEKQRKLQEQIDASKKQNVTYQMFDAMLGL